MYYLSEYIFIRLLFDLLIDICYELLIDWYGLRNPFKHFTELKRSLKRAPKVLKFGKIMVFFNQFLSHFFESFLSHFLKKKIISR